MKVLRRNGKCGKVETTMILQRYDTLKLLPYLSSGTPMGYVSKYVKKLGMGIYNNVNQLGVP